MMKTTHHLRVAFKFRRINLAGKELTTKKQLVLIGLMSLGINIIYGQIHYPLQISNQWQYQEPPPGTSPKTLVFVAKDTILTNGFSYKSLITRNYGYPDTIRQRYLRPIAGKMYEFLSATQTEILRYDFTRNIGDTISVFPFPFGDTAYVTVLAQGTREVFGKTRAYITFYERRYHSSYYAIDEITDSIGQTISQVEPGYQLSLVGAAIGGTIYGTFTGVHDIWPSSALDFSLNQNYPNPFNPRTTIPFHLRREVNVRISIWNILGKKICELFEGRLESGFHAIIWEGTDDRKSNVASGTYFYRLDAGDFVATKKLVLLR